MTTKVGILEWLSNSAPLKMIVEDEMNKHPSGKKYSLLQHPATTDYHKWLSGFLSKSVGKQFAKGVLLRSPTLIDDIPHVSCVIYKFAEGGGEYKAMYMAAKRDDVVQAFEKVL